jgi:hypothetical protein
MSQSSKNNQEKEEVRFLSVDEFKSQNNLEAFHLKYNQESKKHFIAAPDGRTWKAQGDIDPKKPIQFIVAKSAKTLDEACLINYDDTKGAQTVASF